MTHLLCYLHPLQRFSEEAEVEAEALKRIGLEADPGANFTASTSL